MIQLVMSDLDGTLLRNDKTVSETTIAALKQLQDAGIRFGIATGRSLVAVEPLIHTWGIASYCDVLVGLNGGQIIERTQGIQRVTHLLGGSIIQDIMKLYGHLDVNFGIYKDRILYTNKADALATRLAKNNRFELVVTDFQTLLQEDQGKLIILANPAYMPVVEAFAQEHPNEAYHCFKTDAHMFEFMHPLVSKSYGIQEVCKMYGIDMHQVMVFGDNDNDIEMIRDAGMGVCMANGTEQAKAVAKHLASTNEEDGLAHFVTQYLQNISNGITVK